MVSCLFEKGFLYFNALSFSLSVVKCMLQQPEHPQKDKCCVYRQCLGPSLLIGRASAVWRQSGWAEVTSESKWKRLQHNPAFFSWRWKWSVCWKPLLRPVVCVVWPLTSLPCGCSRASTSGTKASNSESQQETLSAALDPQRTSLLNVDLCASVCFNTCCDQYRRRRSSHR